MLHVLVTVLKKIKYPLCYFKKIYISKLQENLYFKAAERQQNDC